METAEEKALYERIDTLERQKMAMMVVFGAVVICVGLVTGSGDEGTTPTAETEAAVTEYLYVVGCWRCDDEGSDDCVCARDAPECAEVCSGIWGGSWREPEAVRFTNGEAVQTGPDMTWNSITKVLTWNGVQITEPEADEARGNLICVEICDEGLVE